MQPQRPPEPDPARQFAYWRSVSLQAVLLLGGIAAFVFLLVVLNEWLSPLAVGVAGGVLLWPIRRQPAVKALYAAGGLLLGFWFLQRAGAALAPFVIVLLLAYLSNPLVSRLQKKWHVPRSASALMVSFVVVGLIALLFVGLVPMIIDQLQRLGEDLITLVFALPDRLAQSEIAAYLEDRGVIDLADVEQQLRTLLPSQIAAIAGLVPDTVGQITRSIGSILEVVMIVALFPVILYYTLKDYPIIRDALVGLFPKVNGSRGYLTRGVGIVGGYLRGQLMISGISIITISVGLTIFNVPFALLIGVLSGFLNLIPSIGTILTYILAGLFALAFGTPANVVAALGVVAAQQIFEGSVLTPKILSHQVGLHPVLVMLSLFVFGAFMGLLGLLIAVPAAALLVTVYVTFKETMTLDLGGERTRLVMPSGAPDTPRPAAEAIEDPLETDDDHQREDD